MFRQFLMRTGSERRRKRKNLRKKRPGLKASTHLQTALEVITRGLRGRRRATKAGSVTGMMMTSDWIDQRAAVEMTRGTALSDVSGPAAVDVMMIGMMGEDGTMTDAGRRTEEERNVTEKRRIADVETETGTTRTDAEEMTSETGSVEGRRNQEGALTVQEAVLVGKMNLLNPVVNCNPCPPTQDALTENLRARGPVTTEKARARATTIAGAQNAVTTVADPRAEPKKPPLLVQHQPQL